MIRKLTQTDHDQVMALITPEASFNLFTLGNIENHGYDSEDVEIFGDFDPDTNLLRGVLYRYTIYFGVYGLPSYDAAGFAKLLDNYDNVFGLSGKKDVMEIIAPHVPQLPDFREMFFAECTLASLKPQADSPHPVQKATPQDAPDIVTLEYSIEEFGREETQEIATTRKADNLARGISRTHMIRIDNQVVSASSTAAENSQSAMLVGVCTATGHRNQGYVSAILSKQLPELFESKQTVCLFYDNPRAGDIYKRLGFYDIGKYVTLKPAQN